MIKRIIVSVILSMVVSSILVLGGVHVGKNKAFEAFILEECWLNKTTRDIECIQYIAD